MARLTQVSKLPFMWPVVLVTLNTLGVNVKLPIYMAFDAVQIMMLASQGELSLSMVNCRWLPSKCGMAIFARISKLPIMRLVVLVAGDTLRVYIKLPVYIVLKLLHFILSQRLA